MDQYHKLLKENNLIQKYGDKIKDFNHFYQPSPEFQKYIAFFKIGVIGGGVYIVSRYIW